MKIKSSLCLIIVLSILWSSCALMKRCHNRQCGVRMEHYHNGYEYRGVSLFEYIFKYRNPRTGNGYPELVKDPSSEVKNKK